MKAAAAGGTQLIPPETDLHARALFEQAASIEISNFDPHAVTIIMQRLAVPMRGGTTDEARVQEAITVLGGRLEGYERLLAKQKYLAGDSLTIADLFHLPIGSWLGPQGVNFLTDEEKYPNVAR